MMHSDVIDRANDLAALEIDHILRARANASTLAHTGPAATSCADCDDDLPPARIAMHAPRCVICQEREDKRARLFRR